MQLSNQSELNTLTKPIPGFPGYHISQTGQVFTRKNAQLATYKKGELLYVTLKSPTSSYYTGKPVHRLVAQTYCGPVPKGTLIKHLDGDKTNNHVSNLQLTNATRPQ